MIFFNKKKENQNPKDQEGKKRSLEEMEADLTVLNKSEMNKLGGGKETTKTLNHLPDLRDSLGGTIPL